MRAIAIAFITLFIYACGNSHAGNTGSADSAAVVETVPTVYFNGDILTMEGKSPRYVEAIVVKDGKIAFTGSKEEAEFAAGAEHAMVDLEHRTMLPGFIDAHSHYFNSLSIANQCNVYPPPSGPGNNIHSIINALKQFATGKKVRKGEEIIAYGYDDNAMSDGLVLNRDNLDRAFPDNPVRIDHVSMHGTVMNSLALKKYGYTADTKTPPGGLIVRKPGTTEPWGLIMETAMLPALKKTASIKQEDEIAATKAGQMLYAQAGITTAQEGLTHADQYITMKRAADAGANIIDIVAYPFIMDLDNVLKEIPVSDFGKYNNGLKVQGVKITVDGSPQRRTAYFTTPYLTGGPAGQKFWLGELTAPQDTINKWVKKVYNMQVPLILHCNGDAAIDAFLKAYAYARDTNFTRPWNVTTIHTQFLRKNQIPLFVKYKIRPSFYTLHTYYFYEAHLKNRGKWQAPYISPMRDAINAGLKPTNHTDFVVSPLDQMMMLWSAVNRISRAGALVGPDQRITPYEGLQAMTINVAEQYDERDGKGSIKVGKRADLVILDKNPLKVDPLSIKDLRVLQTIKDGKTIYKQ